MPSQSQRKSFERLYSSYKYCMYYSWFVNEFQKVLSTFTFKIAFPISFTARAQGLYLCSYQVMAWVFPARFAHQPHLILWPRQNEECWLGRALIFKRNNHKNTNYITRIVQQLLGSGVTAVNENDVGRAASTYRWLRLWCTCYIYHAYRTLLLNAKYFWKALRGFIITVLINQLLDLQSGSAQSFFHWKVTVDLRSLFKSINYGELLYI